MAAASAAPINSQLVVKGMAKASGSWRTTVPASPGTTANWARPSASAAAGSSSRLICPTIGGRGVCRRGAQWLGKLRHHGQCHRLGRGLGSFGGRGAWQGSGRRLGRLSRLGFRGRHAGGCCRVDNLRVGRPAAGEAPQAAKVSTMMRAIAASAIVGRIRYFMGSPVGRAGVRSPIDARSAKCPLRGVGSPSSTPT